MATIVVEAFSGAPYAVDAVVGLLPPHSHSRLASFLTKAGSSSSLSLSLGSDGRQFGWEDGRGREQEAVTQGHHRRPPIEAASHFLRLLAAAASILL